MMRNGNQTFMILILNLVMIVEVKAECYVDDDCAYSDVCNEGSCINACRLLRCGNNAKCETGKHSARCICLPGYTGNAQTECSLCKLHLGSCIDS